MLTLCNVPIHQSPVCWKPIRAFTSNDFLYYDKDGFELNSAERKFYYAMGYPINSLLNHVCWQEPWYTLADHSLMLDHCMILHRCSYDGEARDQLEQVARTITRAQLLLQSKQKWGYDFALDAVSPTGEVYEVLHVEQDSMHYDQFVSKKQSFEDIVHNTDWNDVARQVWNNRHHWIGLRGFEQNNWKSNFVLGWTKAESIEKCL